MTALAKRDSELPLDEPPHNLVRADAASLITVISRAASDPNTDVEKLERLYGMYERIAAQQAKTAYFEALAAMQPNLPTIDRKGRIEVPAKDGRTGHSTPYARWEDINEAIRPVLATHGFGLSFRIGMAQDGKIEVTGVLSHRAGHAEQTSMTLMHDSTGSKNAVQAMGSSASYGKRYTAMALLNITSRAPQDADDDGNAAGQVATAREQSAACKACMTALNAVPGNRAALKAWNEKTAAMIGTFAQAEQDLIIATFNERWAKAR